MVLEIKSESPSKGSGLLLLEGKLNIYSVCSLKTLIDEELKIKKTLDIDLSGITDIDTAGFQLCIYAYREAARFGKVVHFVNPSRSAQRLFSIYQTEFE